VKKEKKAKRTMEDNANYKTPLLRGPNPSLSIYARKKDEFSKKKKLK